MKLHRMRRAMRNPLSSTGKAVLIGGALVAAAIVGVVVYEKNASASSSGGGGGGGTSPGGHVQLSLNMGNVNQAQTARVGDTVVVSLPASGTPVVPVSYADASSGAVLKFRNITAGATGMVDVTYDVIAAGTETLAINVVVGIAPPVLAFSAPLTVTA